MDNVAYIKQSVNIRDVAEMYSVEFNNRGQAHCPFHDDKNPSATIKNNRFHCWACNLHYDVFDFVQNITGCGFRESMEQLNSMFGLGLDLKKPIPSARLKELKEERARKARDAEIKLQRYLQVAEWFRLLNWAKTELAPKSPDEPLDPLFVFTLHNIDRIEYWLERHL